MATSTTRGERAMVALTARQRAVRALIAENPERFAALVGGERVAVGLPPVAGRKSPDTIRRQIEKAQKRINKLNAELAKMNGG